MSPVTCHQRQQPQTLPLLTPSLYTVGWFANTEQIPQKHQTPKKWSKPLKKSSLVLQFGRCLKSTRFQAVSDGTDINVDIATQRLNRPRGRYSENICMYSKCGESCLQDQTASPRFAYLRLEEKNNCPLQKLPKVIVFQPEFCIETKEPYQWNFHFLHIWERYNTQHFIR